MIVFVFSECRYRTNGTIVSKLQNLYNYNYGFLPNLTFFEFVLPTGITIGIFLLIESFVAHVLCWHA